jgi:glycosyltransferase involved in cell wall biosynthesis
VPRIAALGHEIVISAPYSFAGSPLIWGEWIVEGAVKDQAGNDVLPARYDFHKADLMITLCDPFGLHKCAGALASRNVAMWWPVDCDPMGELDVTVLRESQATPIAISEFGQRVLTAEGAEATLRVPHGVDTDIFRPGDPAVYRRDAGIDPGDFVIGICAMNRDQIRKGFHEQILAFARFHERHPRSVLSMHTAQLNPQGLNLAGMCARLGITDAVRFPDDYLLATNLIGQQQMATWYQGLDVLSSCSYGEGFGVPIIEAQAAGVPVVVTDASAMPELCGAGWVVSGTPYWSPGSGAWWKRPDVDDIVNAYEQAWQAWQDGALPRAQARAFAMQFGADRVTAEFWEPVMKELEARYAA